ncbi:hypothetical protein, partial [Acinetobacter baumannii]|uniref:hypothetical protein n=1 Tax=Acinetobacter baumannii TaxID=470 RepID=UPI003B9878D6
TVGTEHPEWVRTLELLLFKKYERSESILAFAFRFHKQYLQKNCPSKRGTSFNKVRALAST